LNFSRQIFEKFPNIKLYENVFRLKAELFHADRRTDMTKLIVSFRNFVHASKKCYACPCLSFNYCHGICSEV